MSESILPQRALFLFDGPNFYKNMQHAHIDRGNLNYRKLSTNLSMGRTIVDVIFFTSPVDQATDKKNFDNQQRFFEALKKSNVSLRKGNLVFRRFKCRQCGQMPITCKCCGTQCVFKTEKSVDVQLAMALVLGCIQDEYDVAYLASCDSDLVPAIKFVRENGKQVFMLLPVGARGYAVSEVCNTTIPITQDKIDAAQNY